VARRCEADLEGFATTWRENVCSTPAADGPGIMAIRRLERSPASQPMSDINMTRSSM